MIRIKGGFFTKNLLMIISQMSKLVKQGAIQLRVPYAILCKASLKMALGFYKRVPITDEALVLGSIL